MSFAWRATLRRASRNNRSVEASSFSAASPATHPEEFAAADVFVLPSLCGGSAEASYEALAAGLPVVATRRRLRRARRHRRTDRAGTGPVRARRCVAEIVEDGTNVPA